MSYMIKSIKLWQHLICMLICRDHIVIFINFKVFFLKCELYLLHIVFVIYINK